MNAIKSEIQFREVTTYVQKEKYRMVKESKLDGKLAYQLSIEGAIKHFNFNVSPKILKSEMAAYMQRFRKNKRIASDSQPEIFHEIKDVSKLKQPSCLSIYRNYCEKYDVIPGDQAFAVLAGIGDRNNYGSSRSYLSLKEGYEFETLFDGWRVVKRPVSEKQKEIDALQEIVRKSNQRIKELISE